MPGPETGPPIAMQRPGTPFVLEVRPKVPARLTRLEELAGNLAYSWDRGTREVFARLNPSLWEALGHSPKALLRRIDESGKRIVGITNSIHDIAATIRSPLAPEGRLLGGHPAKGAVRREG